MTALRLVRPARPAATRLRMLAWLLRDAGRHPALADARYRAAYVVLLDRLRLEALQ